MKGEGLSLHVSVRDTLAPTLAILRGATRLPMDKLATAIKAGSPILVVEEWAACRSEERAKLLELFDRLCDSGASCEVWLGAERVSRSFLENQVTASRGIEQETEILMDLESGDPSPEALAWHARGLKK